ncbi:hypothetical protein [Natrinema sp. 1APR25-10V2]|uniref:hypothetical protein n=1 Tax=Natrinema sp. 1APR25-10V2 TaxID=2951081 RepID=UPI002875D12D|nr:hypothetical protein [Natrinema sp. 1APR25-10V2]MDS0474553.1 hypothetical protein [Natrinema sp. 1APR25-10V2]
MSQIPNEASLEVRVALEEGSYEAEGDLLYPQIVSTDSILWLDTMRSHPYYQHHVTKDGKAIFQTKTSRLTFEKVVPTRHSPAELTVSNQTTELITADITIFDKGGEIVSQRTLSADPAEDFNKADDLNSERYIGEHDAITWLPTMEIADKLGVYEVLVETGDGRTKRDTFSLDPAFSRYWLQIAGDEILMGSINQYKFFKASPTDRAPYCKAEWYGPIP